MKLSDGTQITIEDGASLDRIIHTAETEAEAVEVCEAITPQNLRHVEFCTADGTAYGIYNDLTANAAPMRQTLEDGGVLVVISMREKTAVELRLDALERSQETQDGAIADIGQALSDIVEA